MYILPFKTLFYYFQNDMCLFYYIQVIFQNQIYINAAMLLLPSSLGIFDSRSGIRRRSTAPLRSGRSISSASEFRVIIGQKCPRPSVDQ